ncbi:MAG: alpha/beta hydrolase [Halobacteria archaeon]
MDFNVKDTAKQTAILTAFSLGVENLIHDKKPEDFPRVTTEGHYELVRRKNAWRLLSGDDLLPVSLMGVLQKPRLAPGVDRLDYGTVGNVPGTESNGINDDEILVFVHGWLADHEATMGRFSLMRHTLRSAGYTSPVVGFSWDTDHRPLEWKSGNHVAEKNGAKLAQFISDFNRSNPDTDIRLLSNSLGATVVLEAIEVLLNSGKESAVRSLSILGGGAPSKSVSRDGRYHSAIQDVVEKDVRNYWISHDDTLNRLYKNVEFEPALGGRGALGETPESYRDVRVDYVPDHFSYYRKDKGCVEEVVKDFA